MDKEQAIKKLDAIVGFPTIRRVNPPQYDNEACHDEADNILLECVDPEIKQKYLEIKEKIGFWYA